MVKALWKAIMTRSRLKHMFKNPNITYWNNYEHQRIFVLIYFEIQNLIIFVTLNKGFKRKSNNLGKIRPFFSDKSLENSNITLKVKCNLSQKRANLFI